MVRKFFAVASLGLSLSFVMAAYGQTAVPSDSVTVQMGNMGPAPAPNGHLQVQYNVNAQGVDQSQDSFIRFNLSSLPAGLTPANIQSASLTLFVDAGGSPGTVTVCQSAGPPTTPLWSSSTITGTTAPSCSSVATTSFNVSSTQLHNGSFIVVDVTPIVKDWVNGSPNNGIELVATPRRRLR